MGLTWSDPVITRVRVAVDGDTTPGGHERWVAVFGAGYDAASDPDSSPNAYSTSALRGRAIYMVDLTNGKVLAKKVFTATATNDATGAQYGYPAMKYAVASQPAVFDLDFDGFADVIYMGDLGGNVWKWVVTAVGDDPIHNTTSNKSIGQPDWPFKLFFQANYSNSPNPPVYGTTHFQSFFFPPTGVLRHGSLALAIGAGERAAPESGVLDGNAANNDNYYVMRDTDPLERLATPNDTLSEADLVDSDSLDAGTYSCAQVAAGSGYFITARDREKFITNSVIFMGDVFTSSYIPAADDSDPCVATGTSYLYRFSLDCGAGEWTDEPGTAADKRRRLIGTGLPTRPRVSVGGLNSGGAGGGGCESKVVVVTSDGAIDNNCPAPLPSSGVKIRSWRER
jgi:type IV pilus assembly protein PilY1